MCDIRRRQRAQRPETHNLKNETTMTTNTKSDPRNEAEEICGCILDDCPISGDLLAKLRWIRAHGMGHGTDGEICLADLSRLIEKIETAS